VRAVTQSGEDFGQYGMNGKLAHACLLSARRGSGKGFKPSEPDP